MGSARDERSYQRQRQFPRPQVEVWVTVQVQWCFTSTETIRAIRDGEPRTATSTFTHLLRSVLQCYFASTETIRAIRDGEPMTATSTFTQLLSSAHHSPHVPLLMGKERGKWSEHRIRKFDSYLAEGQACKAILNCSSLLRSNYWQLLALSRRDIIQTHKRFRRTLFIRTKHNKRIFGVIPFIKLQTTLK